jgi:hypothetical protein
MMKPWFHRWNRRVGMRQARRSVWAGHSETAGEAWIQLVMALQYRRTTLGEEAWGARSLRRFHHALDRGAEIGARNMRSAGCPRFSIRRSGWKRVARATASQSRPTRRRRSLAIRPPMMRSSTKKPPAASLQRPLRGWGARPHQLAVLLARRSRAKPTLPHLKFLDDEVEAESSRRK